MADLAALAALISHLQTPAPRVPTFGQNFPALYAIPGQHPGLVTKGNIDLSARPIVRNPDGTISTVRSISIGVGGHEVLIPTVVNGRVVSNQQAINHYRQTGQHLGVFTNPQAANRYAQLLHQQQAGEYT